MGDFPLHILVLPPLAVTTLTVPFLAVVWGGRAVAGFVGLAFVAILGYLVWGFGFGGIRGGTGMEGLGLFLFSIWWAVGALWCGFFYLGVALLGGLPRQRTS
ncbi:MAG: hypothetical protein AAF689_13475 [Pseudomonadota bacterium]